MYPNPEMKDMPIAQGRPANASDGQMPVASAVAVAVPQPSALPTFEVQVPQGMGPGSSFIISVGGEQHSIIVPEGAGSGQVLTCMIVPAGVRPGQDVIVLMKQGEMAVTIPDMAPGEILIVDVGTGLQQYVEYEEESWMPMELQGANNGCCGRVGRVLAFVTLFILFTSLIVMMMRPHGYGGGYGGGYGHGYGGGYQQHPGVSQYQQHLLANSNVHYGAEPPSPPSLPIDPNDYPGKDEGFERGVDDKGNEVYRYEQNNQVYIIPSNDYYGWRSEHYHGHLTHDILTILLVSHLYSSMMYPRGMYCTHAGAGTLDLHRPFRCSQVLLSSPCVDRWRRRNVSFLRGPHRCLLQ